MNRKTVGKPCGFQENKWYDEECKKKRKELEEINLVRDKLGYDAKCKD